MNINVLIPLILLVVMAAVITIALGYPYLQAKLSVLCVGVIILILSSVQLLREVRIKKKRAREPAESHQEREHVARAVDYVYEGVWMVGLAITILLFGFIITIPFYTYAYMKSHGSKPVASIITGVFMAAACYGIFSLLLEMDLYSGMIILWLGPW